MWALSERVFFLPFLLYSIPQTQITFKNHMHDQNCWTHLHVLPASSMQGRGESRSCNAALDSPSGLLGFFALAYWHRSSKLQGSDVLRNTASRSKPPSFIFIFEWEQMFWTGGFCSSEGFWGTAIMAEWPISLQMKLKAGVVKGINSLWSPMAALCQFGSNWML